MLVAVFRDLKDLSGLNDLLNVLQSLLVRANGLANKEHNSSLPHSPLQKSHRVCPKHSQDSRATLKSKSPHCHHATDRKTNALGWLTGG